MQTMKILSICLGLFGNLVACMPNQFSPTESTATASQSPLAIEPQTEANDRPTEAGAGVPGYLVNCSDINTEGELVQVGCNVATMNGKRVRTSTESWTHYEAKVSSKAHPAITVSKSMAGIDDFWDVIFAFTGASATELRMAAQTSAYSYTQVNGKGETVRVETPPPVETPKVVTTPTSQACTDGVLVEGICLLTVL
jgi:hypothetical protein